MKCTVNHHKFRQLLLPVITAVLLLSGCGSSLDQAYDAVDTSRSYGIGAAEAVSFTTFAQDLCVIEEGQSVSCDGVDATLSAGAALFCLDTQEVLFANDIFSQKYPASMTKVMTAYLVLEYGNPDDTVTVSETAMDLDEGSSVCGLAAGDTLTVRDVLYGLMLRSGNEAANVLAEYLSGSIDAFVEEMNDAAQAMGATDTHFANANGLQDEDHYSTVYDIYLIFQTAIQNEEFLEIISASSYTASYTDVNGDSVTQNWSNRILYFDGTYEAPEGVTVIGGKTGTTSDAGNCLVLLSESESGKSYISVVMGGYGQSNLYTQTTQLLSAEE